MDEYPVQKAGGRWENGSVVGVGHHSPTMGGISLAASSRASASLTMTTISTTPPVLQGPTAKEKKYDRQLRLWAAAGQQALEESHVLLLNGGAGVVGIETLKNLVLPGIGNFTVVDGKLVDEEDLGVNFFLSEESLGRSRAEETCRFLRELNPEANGQGVAIVGASILRLYNSYAV